MELGGQGEELENLYSEAAKVKTEYEEQKEKLEETLVREADIVTSLQVCISVFCEMNVQQRET